MSMKSFDSQVDGVIRKKSSDILSFKKVIGQVDDLCRLQKENNERGMFFKRPETVKLGQKIFYFN